VRPRFLEFQTAIGVLTDRKQLPIVPVRAAVTRESCGVRRTIEGAKTAWFLEQRGFKFFESQSGLV